MDRAAWLEFFKTSPQQVKDYLLDDAALDGEDRARSMLGFDADIWERVMDVIWTQVFTRISEQDFRSRIAQIAGDRSPQEIEKIVLRYIILPLADMVPWDVERRLQELGFSLGDIQSVNRISLRPVSYGAAVRRIAAQAKVTLLSEESVKRCRDILVSYIKGVRLMPQVKEMLQRSQAEGGVGFTHDQTDAFVTQMVDFLEKTKVLSEQEYVDWFSTFRHQLQSDQITGRQESDSAEEGTSSEDPDALPANTVKPMSVRNAQTILDQAIQDALAAIAWTGEDAFLVKRLHSLLSTRLRDVRNASQTKDMLSRDIQVGGMGLAPEEAERIATIIEEQYKSHRDMITDEEKRKILEVKQHQEQKIAERKARESQEHAEWFEKKVRSAQTQDDNRRAFFERMKQAAANQVQVAQSIAQSTPAAPVSPPAPSMDVISAPTRLVGLTEELEDMDLQTFRRMARLPSDSAKKIIQILEALKSESFERWTEGVQSWRTSPLQQAYLKLVGESFRAGHSVIELIDQKRKTDPNLLTAEEVGAILEINAHAQL